MRYQVVIQNGLMIEYETKARQIRLNAAIKTEKIGESELVLVFVKSNQTESAAKTASQLSGDNGLVLTLQNGMGNAETIAEYIMPARILVGTTAHSGRN